MTISAGDQASAGSEVAAEAPDLIIERVEIPGPAGQLAGYLAHPSGEGSSPGIVMVHDRNGSDAHNQDVSRRLASAGYCVLLVDLYSRGGGTAALQASGKPVYEAAPIATDDGIADLCAGLDWLESQPRIAAGKLGAIGFCMGGRLALLLAERRADLRTTIVYYGLLGAQGGHDPIADAHQIKGSLLGHFGEEDRAIPVPQVKALESALQAAMVRAEIHIYPGAGHAFNNDRNPQAYRPAAARLAWERTLEWLHRDLG